MKVVKLVSGALFVMFLFSLINLADALPARRFAPKDRGMGPREGAVGPEHRDFGAGSRGRIEGLARMLALTEEQKAKMLEQDQLKERELLPFRQKIETLSMKMEGEMSMDKPDRNKIESYIKEINQNRLQIQLKRVDSMLKFRENLSADQKAKLKKMAERGRKDFQKDSEKPK